MFNLYARGFWSNILRWKFVFSTLNHKEVFKLYHHAVGLSASKEKNIFTPINELVWNKSI